MKKYKLKKSDISDETMQTLIDIGCETDHKLIKKEIPKRIKRISEMDGESDLQHCAESVMYHNFVECIVEGKYDTKKEIKGIAKELIKVMKLDYERWFK